MADILGPYRKDCFDEAAELLEARVATLPRLPGSVQPAPALV